MMLLDWLQARTTTPSRQRSQPRWRKPFGQTTLPLISPRRGRRVLRREQLFAVVRESMIRGGVLSTSYEFKVLTLDADGDRFLVLIDLALPAEVMPDAHLLEIERWIQASAGARHEMKVGSVYWRRKAVHDQRGLALRAAVTAQTRHETPAQSATPIPKPAETGSSTRGQPVGVDELEAFRRALASLQVPTRSAPPEADVLRHQPVPESHSDFNALSATQYGKL